MRDGVVDRARGGVPPQALALLLGGTALFLAVENAVLLFVLGPALGWPAALEPVALGLRVARVLLQALAPWIALGLATTLAAGASLWAFLKFRREVHHA